MCFGVYIRPIYSLLIMVTKNILITTVFATLVTLVQSQIEPKWLRFPAISPDGSQIAFCYNGDIFIGNSNGEGLATPIVNTPSYEDRPVWSPDGKWIAYNSDENGNEDVYIISSSGGMAKRLTFHSSSDGVCDFSNDSKSIVFNSFRQDDPKNQLFPTPMLGELYTVSIDGGRESRLFSLPLMKAQYSPDGKKILYQDIKGYEDPLRKHHTSSVTRDVWVFDIQSGQHTRISSFAGEDLNPVWSDDSRLVYYTSEEFGSFNVVAKPLSGGSSEQITFHKDHPVRSLTISANGIICYVHHGDVYVKKPNEGPKKVNFKIFSLAPNKPMTMPIQGISEFSLSPNGKEFAFVSRGEVFVSSVAEGTTKRITNTPEQERSVDFSPDGRSIVYAGERNGSWNLYITSLKRKEEKYFFNSTLLQEEALLTGTEETFQPSFSPNGKEVAYLEERTALKVVDISSKATRLIVPGERNYSYADGDQYYQWSPDGQWFLVSYLPGEKWIGQVGLVSSDGKGTIRNLTESGYGGEAPQWMMSGEMMIWLTSRNGMKNHASWGFQSDVYGAFFTKKAFDEFKMNQEEYDLYKEMETSKDTLASDAEKNTVKDKKKGSKKEETDQAKKENLKLELDDLNERKVRLTIHSGFISDAYVTNDGSKLYYLCMVEKGFDLWETNLKTKETKIALKLGIGGGAIEADSAGTCLFVLGDGVLTKIDLLKNEPKPIMPKGEITVDEQAERAYLFEHIWRQVVKKFYVENLHNVDWNFYKKEYQAKLSDIYNNADFADMMSEMLGELNASHTGAGYWNMNMNGDQTATLGLLYDEKFKGNGLKVVEVLKYNTVFGNKTKMKSGVVIEKINGNDVLPNVNYYPLMNKIAGRPTLLSMFNPSDGSRWEETVKPISMGEELELLYKRWVERNEFIVDSLSAGKLGYVHVRGMDDASFRVVYEKALGKHAFKEGLVVDTRFNGGGWLHDDLATFLSGKEYIRIRPRSQNLGSEPQFKWSKPSIVVMSESNYSDAHLFPYTYKELGIGKLVGMPVPGTGTAVWWEMLQNGVVFGIPQVGMIDDQGNPVENQQLEPDFKVPNTYESVIMGVDMQLQKAVEELLK